MWQVRAFWAAFVARTDVRLGALALAMPELALRLARVVAAEAAGNTILNGLDAVTGLGLANSVWLVVLPVDLVVKALVLAFGLLHRFAPKAHRSVATPVSAVTTRTWAPRTVDRTPLGAWDGASAFDQPAGRWRRPAARNRLRNV